MDANRNMKNLLTKLVLIQMLILINFSCSPLANSIRVDKKTQKIDDRINPKKHKRPFESYLCWHCEINNEFDQLVIYKNGNEIKKIAIDSDRDGIQRKCQIYFENNIPILISESFSGENKINVTGQNLTTNSLVSEVKFNVSKNYKIYINNWEKFDINIVGTTQSEYSMSDYKKLTETILTQLVESEKK